VAPAATHAVVADALAAADLRLVDHLHDLAPHEVPVFAPENVKGLELDGVVVVRPHEILGDGAGGATPRGARLLYVAMTRAVQRLTFVTDAPAPTVIADPG
jgi:DNA helicase IV